MASGNDPANVAYIIAENGFYYVAYKEKVKVPEIVVSSKGVANGLSEEYNDGWDFGPDSYSPTSTSAIPYTETVGWQEAWNYAQINNINKIVSKSNNKYIISNPIYLNPNGVFTNPLEIDGQNSLIQISSSNLALNPIEISNNPNNTTGQPMYPLKLHGFIFDGNGSTSNYTTINFNQYGYTGNNPDIMIEIYGNKFQNGSNGNIIVEQQSYTLSIHDNIFLNVGANGPIFINGQNSNCGLFIYANEFIAGALSVGSNAIGINNNDTTTSISSPMNNAQIYGNYFGNTSNAPTSNISDAIVCGDPGGAGWNGAIISNNIFNLTAGWINGIASLGNTAFNINFNDNISLVPITIVVQDGLISSNLFIGTVTVYGNGNFRGNRIYSTSGYGFAINTGNDRNIVIDGNTITFNGSSGFAIYFTDTSVTGSTYIVNNNLFNGSNIGINTLSGLIFMGNRTSTGAYPFSPSTPTVPASATAQQNTNPYPVDVYIYGGDVTEIQITRNGTAYTVLSVSTAIAMSGQAYKLNPGDSITITYSTAPSWEWLSD